MQIEYNAKASIFNAEHDMIHSFSDHPIFYNYEIKVIFKEDSFTM